jgi:hypothetical protein
MAGVNGGSGVERALLSDVSVDVGWRLIERFSSLVRESGNSAGTGSQSGAWHFLPSRVALASGSRAVTERTTCAQQRFEDRRRRERRAATDQPTNQIPGLRH